MKSFRERNPLTLALVGSLLLAVVLTGTFSYDDLPVIGSGVMYAAEFGEAAGLQPEDEVRVAGIKVGTVKKVELADDHVLVRFRVKDTWIGDKTSAEIRIKTLLGRKFLALRPLGGAGQDPDRPIPRDRTVTPFDVTDAFNGLAGTASAIDTGRLAESFRSISDAFKGTPDYVRTALDGLSALSRTIASRDDQLADLLKNTKTVSGTLADSSQEFDKLIDDGNLLLTELNRRRDAIHSLLVGSQRLAGQLSGLVEDNAGTLTPMLRDLNTVTDILRRQNENLDKALQLAGPYFRVVNNFAGNGRWLDNYICGLVPQNRNPCVPPKPGGGR